MQAHIARLAAEIVDEHARLRAVRRLLIAASAVSLAAIGVCVLAFSGWLDGVPGHETIGWTAAVVSAVAVPVCALLATGVRRGRRYVLGMIAEYDRLRAGDGARA